MTISIRENRATGARGGVRGVAALTCMLALTLAACQSPPPPAPPRMPPPQPVELCERPAFDGGRAFIVEAWGVPDNRFDVGEPLRFQMRVSTPSYVNVFHVGTSCKVTRLLRDLRMREAEIVDFPLAGSGIEITVKPPAGDEAFYVVATRAPADFLADADLLGAGDITSLDLSPAQFYQRLRQARGRVDPNDLSMTTLRTSVIAH